MRLRIRFSLRTFVVFITFIALTTCFLTLRYKHRADIQKTIEKLQAMDAKVWFAQQEPEFVSHTDLVPNYFCRVSRNGGNVVPSGRFITRNNVSPKFRVTSFLFGSNEDISVTAISISSNSVDESTVELLAKLKDLKEILLRVDELYLSVSVSQRSTTESRQAAMKRLGEDIHRARELLDDNFPNVSIRYVPEKRKAVMVLLPEAIRSMKNAGHKFP